MNNRARINGQNYTLLEIVLSLNGADVFILCVDEQGEKRICPEQRWRAGELEGAPMTVGVALSDFVDAHNSLLFSYDLHHGIDGQCAIIAV